MSGNENPDEVEYLIKKNSASWVVWSMSFSATIIGIAVLWLLRDSVIEVIYLFPQTVFFSVIGLITFLTLCVLIISSCELMSRGDKRG